MSLMICPECGHDMSSLAEACPNCGYRLNSEYKTEENTYKESKTDYSGLIGGLIGYSILRSLFRPRPFMGHHHHHHGPGFHGPHGRF